MVHTGGLIPCCCTSPPALSPPSGARGGSDAGGVCGAARARGGSFLWGVPSPPSRPPAPAPPSRSVCRARCGAEWERREKGEGRRRAKGLLPGVRRCKETGVARRGRGGGGGGGGERGDEGKGERGRLGWDGGRREEGARHALARRPSPLPGLPFAPRPRPRDDPPAPPPPQLTPCHTLGASWTTHQLPG